MTDLAASLDAALAELAVDPIGVLRASGVKGNPHKNCNCPVARFVEQKVGELVSVNGFSVRIVSTNENRKLPARVKQAIREIDAGMHSELCV